MNAYGVVGGGRYPYILLNEIALQRSGLGLLNTQMKCRQCDTNLDSLCIF